MIDVEFTDHTFVKNGIVFREIRSAWGSTLEEVSEILKELHIKGYNVYTKFNNRALYSDEDSDVNNAYLKVVGVTYDEFKKKEQESNENFRKAMEKFEERKPLLIENYIKKGHEILDEKYWEKWDRIVPIRVSDLYHGMELSNGLEIIEALNKGKSFEECMALFSDDHSGMSYGLTAAVIAEFADQGREFYNYIYKKE